MELSAQHRTLVPCQKIGPIDADGPTTMITNCRRSVGSRCDSKPTNQGFPRDLTRIPYRLRTLTDRFNQPHREKPWFRPRRQPQTDWNPARPNHREIRQEHICSHTCSCQLAHNIHVRCKRCQSKSCIKNNFATAGRQASSGLIIAVSGKCVSGRASPRSRAGGLILYQHLTLKIDHHVSQ